MAEAEQEGITGNSRRDTVTLVRDNTSFPRELSTCGTVWTNTPWQQKMRNKDESAFGLQLSSRLVIDYPWIAHIQ